MTIAQFARLQYGLFLRFLGKPAPTTRAERSLIEQFHKLYYDAGEAGGTWHDTWWLGTKVLKCPLDLWVYQEIIGQTRPDWIIETGTCQGGSAFYLACICDWLDRGQIISIDIQHVPTRPQHKRIQYLTGSSVAEDIVATVKAKVGSGSGLVILDSDHSQRHVARELDIYSQFVAPGNYLVVEDTNLNGHPINPEHGPGPMEALDEFVARNHAFEIDASKEKFFMTFNPHGYLKRVR